MLPPIRAGVALAIAALSAAAGGRAQPVSHSGMGDAVAIAAATAPAALARAKPDGPGEADAASTGAPSVALNYVVFFDNDSAVLTPLARQLIAVAADNATHIRFTAVQVNGHADASGSHDGNQVLSEERARAVAAELAEDGVPARVIRVHGFGDADPLVPAPPQAAEPQNRRAEIVIR